MLFVYSWSLMWPNLSLSRITWQELSLSIVKPRSGGTDKWWGKWSDISECRDSSWSFWIFGFQQHECGLRVYLLRLGNFILAQFWAYFSFLLSLFFEALHLRRFIYFLDGWSNMIATPPLRENISRDCFEWRRVFIGPLIFYHHQI